MPLETTPIALDTVPQRRPVRNRGRSAWTLIGDLIRALGLACGRSPRYGYG